MGTNRESERQAEHVLQGPELGHSAQFGYDASQHDLSVRIIESIAAVEEVGEREISTPLSETIDPEALDVLFADSARGEVSFTFCDHNVVISVFSDGTGQIYID